MIYHIHLLKKNLMINSVDNHPAFCICFRPTTTPVKFPVNNIFKKDEKKKEK